MKNKCCKLCDHWHRELISKEGQPAPVGQCRANPPQLVLVPMAQGLALQGHFPSTAEDLFCGQWKLYVSRGH